ncbi:IS3 family transposase, partial [Burkholderia cepacia]|uniref:IS3 family transposase n=1 Tax=Burkholderia cepacia TaxID=292 RepID=UPI001E33B443
TTALPSNTKPYALLHDMLYVKTRQGQHHMVPSMSRRGNCHDNAVAESFFSALKKERIKRRIYPSRAAATSNLFDYIEMFYNPIRRHGSAGDLSPIEFERRYALNGS